MAASGRFWEVPEDAYPALYQGGVIPNHARNRADALAFRAFLLSPESAQILRRYGFAAGSR
jgi:ABC-type molybdate transport system substrate-binding protein